MAFPKRVDANQKSMTKLFRDSGLSVAIISSIGKGLPDLIVASVSKTVLVELKDGAKCASQRNLTPCEQVFHDNWVGEIKIIATQEEALALIDYLRA